MAIWVEQMRKAVAAHSFAPQARQFFFLRHGETGHNNARICQGQTDVPLNERGIEQAGRAADILAQHEISQITASDLSRVGMTVAPLIDRTGLPVKRDIGLRERGFGVLEGHPIPDDLWDREDENVETIEAFAHRVLDTVQRVLIADNILIAAHGGVLRIIAAGFGLQLQPFAFANAQPLRFVASDDGFEASVMLSQGLFDATQPLPPHVEPPSLSTGSLIAVKNPA